MKNNIIEAEENEGDYAPVVDVFWLSIGEEENFKEEEEQADGDLRKVLTNARTEEKQKKKDTGEKVVEGG